MNLDHIFENKVYAGVLGKIIGVYLGRPFEGWPYDKIMKELGPIYYYVNDKLNVPMLVSDDDLNGTFTFIKAFTYSPSFEVSINISPILPSSYSPVWRYTL